MTDFTTFVASLKEWTAREDWTDLRIAEIIKLAEEELDKLLRVGDMVMKLELTLDVNSRSVEFPSDWLACDAIYIDTIPISYLTSERFRRKGNLASAGFYTIEGRRLLVGGNLATLPTQEIMLHYFSRVPKFLETPGDNTWVQNFYYKEFLWLALFYAFKFIPENETAEGYKRDAYDAIQACNFKYANAKVSGSTLTLARGDRGFNRG